MTTTEDQIDKLFGQIVRETIPRYAIESELRALFHHQYDETHVQTTFLHRNRPMWLYPRYCPSLPKDYKKSESRFLR